MFRLTFGFPVPKHVISEGCVSDQAATTLPNYDVLLYMSRSTTNGYISSLDYYSIEFKSQALSTED